MFQRSFNVWPISAWVSCFFFEKSSRVSLRLPVLRDKLRRFHIVRFPIEIENLIVRPQKILGVPMAIEAPRHAVRLGRCEHRRHMIDRAVATETAYAPVHMRRVVVINVIDRAIEPHPLDGLPALPALLYRLQLRDYLFPPAYGSSCMSAVFGTFDCAATSTKL